MVGRGRPTVHCTAQEFLYIVEGLTFRSIVDGKGRMSGSSRREIVLSRASRLGDVWVACYACEGAADLGGEGMVPKGSFVRTADGARWELVAVVSSRPIVGQPPSRQAVFRSVEDRNTVHLPLGG